MEEGLSHGGLAAEVALLPTGVFCRLHLAVKGTDSARIPLCRWRRQADAGHFGQPYGVHDAMAPCRAR